MVPDKFNMVDMGGIDLIMMQGEEVPGLYDRLVESIAQCRFQVLYNWMFDGIQIPPTFVELETDDNDNVVINGGITVTDEDILHIYSLEVIIPPSITQLSVIENGEYTPEAGIDGFAPVVVDVEPTIESLEITENGTYTAVGVDGYSPVVVNVPTGPVEPQLPSEYQEVEYITFDGNEYMLVENLPTEYLIQFMGSNSVSESENCAIGYREEINSNSDFEIRFQWGGLNTWGRSNTYTYVILSALPSGSSLNVAREIYVYHSDSRQKFFIGKYNTQNDQLSFKGNFIRTRLYLYDRTAGTFTEPFDTIREFVPCYRKSDSEPGVYELYTHTFYPNEGIGTLIAGPDAN